MNPKILLQIFNPPFSGRLASEIKEAAFKCNYTMFSFNGEVYSTFDGSSLFKLSDLVINL